MFIFQLITYIYTGRIELPDDIESIKELLNESSMMLLNDVKIACERKLCEMLIKVNIYLVPLIFICYRINLDQRREHFNGSRFTHIFQF